ncbi:hypothetical protein SAMN05421493_11040 [Pseudobutyrivibrio sp. 49]|nr:MULTISPECIES: hypothetical protein [unclassified Pseudobutyrivibrio]SDI23428.1 hypothetical protein SAMN05421493_11040 [Pseudobutyrivibrio sp. 49]SFO14235.1 hypothetical protein SAMN04487831_10987 [Pseudobutyrivibrio sp. UC1225]
MNLLNSIGYYVLIISVLLGAGLGFLGKLYEKNHPETKEKEQVEE